jgi:hypothetical protein
MKRVYVAGSYSAPDVMTVFENMRRGIRVSTEVLLAGFAPFVPWLDYHLCLMLRGEEKLTLQEMYNYSMAWLEVSDAVLVLPNSENSKGTQAEILHAALLEIPIFYRLEDLKIHSKFFPYKKYGTIENRLRITMYDDISQ